MPNGFIVQLVKGATRITHRFSRQNPKRGDRINAIEDLEFGRGSKAWLSEPAPNLGRVVVKGKRNGSIKIRRSSVERGHKAIGIIGIGDLEKVFANGSFLSIGTQVILHFQPGILPQLDFKLTYEHQGSIVGPITLQKDEANDQLILTSADVFSGRNQDEADNFKLEITSSSGAKLNFDLDSIEFYTEQEVRDQVRSVFGDFLRMMKGMNQLAISYMEETEGFVHDDIQAWLTENLGVFDPGELPEAPDQEREKWKVLVATGFHDKPQQRSTDDSEVKVLLRFQPGSEIEVLEKPNSSNGWWKAEFEGIVGWVKHTQTGTGEDRLEQIL